WYLLGMTPPLRYLALVTLAPLAPAALPAQQSGFTIEQVMSAPFPDELTAAPAPTSGAVAWVSNVRGVRNIWAAAPPDYVGPAVSPKGDRVAFISHGQVWWGSFTDSTATDQLIRARGTARSLRWSSDGSKLAFVSDRGDHAFVALYDVVTKTLRYLDPSVDS